MLTSPLFKCAKCKLWSSVILTLISIPKSKNSDNLNLCCVCQVFGGLLMGCINGKQLLNEEDLNYIARNTAMDKAAVEVTTNQTCKRCLMM